MSYARIDEETFSDSLGCFFADRMQSNASLKFPSWASELSGVDYEKKRLAVMCSRGWHEESMLENIIHLEFMARDRYKRKLHEQWVTVLNRSVRNDAEYNILRTREWGQ